MNNFRLLPILTFAIGALFVLKTSGLVLHGGYLFSPISQVQAQTKDAAAPASPAEAGSGPAAKDAPASAGEQKAGGEKDGKAADTAKTDGKDGNDGKEEAAASDQAASTPRVSPLGRKITPGEDATSAKGAILARLAARRKQLENREQQLDLRENLIKATEQRVEKMLAELKQIQTAIEAEAKKKEDEKKAKLTGLVTMYENMKPKDAARLFSELDVMVLLDLVEQMNARKMADILANMTSEAAQRLTLAIAERSRSKTKASGPEMLPKIDSNERG